MLLYTADYLKAKDWKCNVTKMNYTTELLNLKRKLQFVLFCSPTSLKADTREEKVCWISISQTKQIQDWKRILVCKGQTIKRTNKYINAKQAGNLCSFSDAGACFKLLEKMLLNIGILEITIIWLF